MAVYRYFLCEDPTAASPPLDDLATIEADSPAAAARKIKTGRLPNHTNVLWVNILIWTSPDGKQLGFQSLRLADLST